MDDRALVLFLARDEWERTRHIKRRHGQRESEPPWEALSVECRNLWIKNIEDFVKRLRTFEAGAPTEAGKPDAGSGEFAR